MINTYEYETELSNPAFLPMFVPGFHHGANTDNFRQPYPLGTKLPGSVREELHWSGVYRSDYG